jgi:hypothetical protein
VRIRKRCPWCATPIRADRAACTLHEQIEAELVAVLTGTSGDEAEAELEQLEAELARDDES